MLGELGVSEDKLRAALAFLNVSERDTNRDTQSASQPSLISLAGEAARRDAEAQIDTEHLLRAVFQRGGVAAMILDSLHVDRSKVDSTIRRCEIEDTMERVRRTINGAELLIWGQREDIERLIALAARTHRPMDDMIWEAIRQVWFNEPMDR